MVVTDVAPFSGSVSAPTDSAHPHMRETMPDNRVPPHLRPFWPRLLESGVIHAVLFVLIAWLVGSQVSSVRRQEDLFIQDVQAQEERVEEETRQAREQTVKDLLAGQLQAEMDSLIAEELPVEYEEDLSDQTELDIEERVDLADEQYALDELIDEELYELMDDLRGETFEQLRGNLGQMVRDLLLSQVRSYIRLKVAPEIKYRIDQRLKNEVGRSIQSETDRQSHDEKYRRVAAVKQRLDKAIRTLDSLRRQQDTVRSEVQKARFASAREKETALRGKESTNAEEIRQTLDEAQRLSPPLTERARSIQEDLHNHAIGPAVLWTIMALDGIEAATQREQQAADADKPEAHKSIEEHTARAVENAAEATQRMAQAVQQLKAFASELNTTARDRKPDEIQKQVVREALKPVEDALREKVEAEVTQTAIPLAAERIMTALQKDLEARKLNNEKFKTFLEADIRQALTEEMARRKPEPKLALMLTEDRYELRDRVSLDEARERVAEALRKIEPLVVEQEKLRDEVIKESAEEDARRQNTLADKIRLTKKSVAETLREVRRATLRHDGEVYQAIRKMDDTTPERKAVDAAEQVKRELVAEARDLMTETADLLSESVVALKAVEQGLAEEAGEVKERARENLDLTDALGGEGAQQALAKVEEGADKAIEQRVKPAVSAAAQRFEVRYVLTQGPEAATLAQMQQLQTKLDQVAVNMAEGRELGDLPGMALPGPGMGTGLGGGPSDGILWAVRTRQHLSRFNREAYEEFVKDLRYRMDPDTYYEDQAPLDEEEAAADVAPRDVPAVIFAQEPPTAEAAEDEKRMVPTPDFPFKAFGAAAMMEGDVIIDGDLSDWGELRHPLTMQYRGDTLDKVEGGPSVYVRWSADGIYIGYTVKDEDGIQPCEEYPWSGDCLEFMVDMTNSRLPEAYGNINAQKFCFTPFGCRGRTDITVWEMGRGVRGMGMARDYPDMTGRKGKAAAKIIPGYGYTVECFLSRRALVTPQLVAGRYVALNFSLNQRYASGLQWSASQALQTWRRPDTWGDVLLLGADARLRFLELGSADGTELKAITPGTPITIEIADADMNLNTLRTDRVAAELVVKESATSLFVVLTETGHSTGVFRATVDTQAYFLPPRERMLNIRGGDTLQLVYTDARAEYGEKNRRLTAELPVGFPVMNLAGK